MSSIDHCTKPDCPSAGTDHGHLSRGFKECAECGPGDHATNDCTKMWEGNHTRVGLRTRTRWVIIQMGDRDDNRGLYELLMHEGYSTYFEDSDVTTSDGHPLTHGLRVWDYDLHRGTVDLTSMVDGWFYVQTDEGRSLMNWERVCVRHPRTKEPA